MSSRVQRVWGAAIVAMALVALVALAGCSKPVDNTATPNNTTTNNTTTTTAAPDSMATTTATPVSSTTTPAAVVKCAVCGQTVGTPMTVSYEGKDFTVCSQACKDAFEKDPAKYSKAQPS